MNSVTHNTFNTSATNTETQPKTLTECVKDVMDRYFAQLGSDSPFNLYDVVLEQMEEPLLERVMVHCKGNQSKAARILGLSRGTLRTKLRRYFDSRKPGKHTQKS